MSISVLQLNTQQCRFAVGAGKHLDESVLLLRWASNSRQLAVLQLSSKKRGISCLLTEASSNWSMLEAWWRVNRSDREEKGRKKFRRPTGQTLYIPGLTEPPVDSISFLFTGYLYTCQNLSQLLFVGTWTWGYERIIILLYVILYLSFSFSFSFSYFLFLSFFESTFFPF
jgi:hypothetical protein